MKRLLLALVLTMGCESSTEPEANCDGCGTCDTNATNDGVKLWGECYLIDETTELNLYNSGLTGEIPTEIGNLVNLTGLHLGHNQLTGEIPSEIGNLVNLNYLHLYNNQLTGEIPSEIKNLANLTSLWLGNNQLHGEIPDSLCNLLVNECIIHLSHNKLCPPPPIA